MISKKKKTIKEKKKVGRKRTNPIVIKTGNLKYDLLPYIPIYEDEIEKFFLEKNQNVKNKTFKRYGDGALFLNFEEIKENLYEDMKNYEYFYFFMYLFNHKGQDIENNLKLHFSIFLKSFLSYYRLAMIKLSILKDFTASERFKTLKNILLEYIKLRQEGASYNDESKVIGKRRVSPEILNRYLKHLSGISNIDYINSSKIKNLYTQKNQFLLTEIFILNYIVGIEDLNKICKELFVKNILILTDFDTKDYKMEARISNAIETERISKEEGEKLLKIYKELQELSTQKNSDKIK